MTKEVVEFQKKAENKEVWYWCVSSVKYYEILQKKIDMGAYEDNIIEFISFTKTVINMPKTDMTFNKKYLYLNETLNVLKKTIKDEYLTILLEKYNLLKISLNNLEELIKKCNERNELQKKLDEIKKKTIEIMKQYDTNERTYLVDLLKDYMQQLKILKLGR